MILDDDVVRLRPVNLDDVDEWMVGEDEEQIRGFEFPGPAARADVDAAIASSMHSWRTDGHAAQRAVSRATSDATRGSALTPVPRRAAVRELASAKTVRRLPVECDPRSGRR